MKILLLVTELFYADGQAARHKANSRASQFYERPKYNGGTT